MEEVVSEPEKPTSVTSTMAASDAQPTPATASTAAPSGLLEYASPLQAELTHRQRRLATSAAWFGGIPLTLGCLDFLLWIPTRDRGSFFVLGGLIIILIGLLLTFVGGLLLLILLCSIQGSGKFKLFLRTK